MRNFPSLTSADRHMRYYLKKMEQGVQAIPFPSREDIKRLAKLSEFFPSIKQMQAMAHWSYWRGYRTLYDVDLYHLSPDANLSLDELLFTQKHKEDLLEGLPAYFGDDDFPKDAVGMWVYKVHISKAFTMRVKVTDNDELLKTDTEESYVVELPDDSFTEADDDLEHELRNGWGSVKPLEVLEKKIKSAEYCFFKKVGLVYYNDHLAIVRSPKVVDAEEFKPMYRIKPID